MARRKKVEEHENHERWLVSYADFITLLFAFFVVMYSISSVNNEKYRVLASTLENAFTGKEQKEKALTIAEILQGKGKLEEENNPFKLVEEPHPDQLTIPPTEVLEKEVHTPPPIDEDIIRNINDIASSLNNALADLISSNDVSIKQGPDWLELEMKSKVLFYSGEARLSNEAVPIIGEVADILNKSANPIQVEGFTDNNPINTSRFPSNWELSAARAASVVHLLDQYGLAPSRMSAIGYGEFKPITSNATEEGRQKNRRVVLVVLGSKESRRDISVFTPDFIDLESEPLSEAPDISATVVPSPNPDTL